MIPPATLTIVRREQMSIVGLMIGSIIAANLSDPKIAARMVKVKGRVNVVAGQMAVTVSFDRGAVSIEPGKARQARSEVRGSLNTLLQVSLGKGLLRQFFFSDLSFSGNPLLLLKMLPVIRAPQTKEPR